MGTWETLGLLLIAAVAILWFLPGVKRMLEASEKAEKDWPAVLIPLALVVSFVVLLIALV